MHASTTHHLISLQKHLLPAYKARPLSLLSSHHAQSLPQRPPWAHLSSRTKVPIRVVSGSPSKNDGGDDSSALLNNAALQLDLSTLENLAQEVREASAFKTKRDPPVGDAIQGNHQHFPEKKQDHSVHLPNLLGVSDSDLYGMPVEPLPLLPAWSEYPLPHITDPELEDYIIPLYSRKWYIACKFKRGSTDSDKWRKSATLNRNYDFPTFESTMDFVSEVARLCQLEDHFPNIVFEHKQVYICTCTYAAFRNSTSSEDMANQHPGITLRDARIAILMEDAFARHFLASGHALQGKLEIQPDLQVPRSVMEIDQIVRVRKHTQIKPQPREVVQPVTPRRCRVCGGEHDPLACPLRYTKPPPSNMPCIHCNQTGHWSMNCIRVVPSMQRTPLSGESKRPPTPCPQCGGDHWQSDCPKWGHKVVRPPALSMYVNSRH